jgi:hypothetical protein
MRGRQRWLPISASIAVHAAIAAIALFRSPAEPLQARAPVTIRLEAPAEKPYREAESRVEPGSQADEPTEPQARARREQRESARPAPSTAGSDPAGDVAVAHEGSVTIAEGGGLVETASVARRRKLDGVDLRARQLPEGSAPLGVIAQGESDDEGEDVRRRLQRRAGGGYAWKDTTFEMKIARDGTVAFDDESPIKHRMDRGIGSFQFDLNDALIGAAGSDPYAYEKRKALHATKELRAELAEAACRERLASAVRDVRPRLERIWARKDISLELKKKKIFEIWDDCDEEGSPDVVRATVQIRAAVFDFVFENLPREGVFAFSDRDIERLNRDKRSKTEFRPYEN